MNGNISIDEWIWTWLNNRIKWPSADYSIFKNDTIIIDVEMFRVRLVVETGNFNKRRFIIGKIFTDNPYHPTFQERVDIAEHEWRFSSVGNPFIDEPNYLIWEQLVFAKLFNIIMIIVGFYVHVL